MDKKTSLFIIVFFCATLITPNIIMLFNKGSLNTDLNLDINHPLLSIKKLKNHYLKNYGTKSTLINGYINFKLNVLKENPIPYRVISGKNDWLFLGNYYNNVFNNAYGNNTFSTKQLNAIKNKLASCNIYFKDKNIDFHVVVPSDKNKIYPEFLPFQLNKNASNVQLLKNTLPKDLSFIDLKQTLLNQKKKQQLYFKTDTHWNDYGAFCGYTTIMNQINKTASFKPIELTELDSFIDNEFVGDLSIMIQLQKGETITKLKNKHKDDIKVIAYNSYYQHYKNPKGKGKLMVYRDSFSNALIPFFNTTFNEIILIKKYNLDKKLINSFKPDVVIMEIVERNLINLSQIKTPLN